MDTTFTNYNNEIYVRRSSEVTTSSTQLESPTLIILFGWMGAKTQHLQKYTSTYLELYPNATLLLIRCAPTFFFKSAGVQRLFFEPVVRILEEEGCILREGSEVDRTLSRGPTWRPGVLIHVFSNGGAFMLTRLSAFLVTRSLPPYTREITSAIILDSTPGKASIQRTRLAFTMQMRNSALRFLASWIVGLLYCLLSIYYDVLSRGENPLEFSRRILKLPKLMPWTSQKTPRLYAYSLTDDLVDFTDVEQHIADTMQLGFPVETEVYKTSPHVSHMRHDPARYWHAVRKVWGSAGDNN